MTESTSAPVSSVQSISNASASPKKAKKPTKGKSTNGASHPKYSDMIKSALKALNDRSGSSRAVQANQHLKLALKNGVKAKSFKQTKGSGASGSFKLATNGDGKPAKKKSTKAKKPSSSTKSATGTKKRSRSKSAGTKPAKKVATAANTNSSAATPAAPAATTATPAAAKPKKVKVVKPSAKPKSTGAKKTKGKLIN
jgi:hypothetical protein